jgi:hypothetical protein
LAWWGADGKGTGRRGLERIGERRTLGEKAGRSPFFFSRTTLNNAMNNTWLKRVKKRHLKRQLFDMPTTLNDEREVEFEAIPGSLIPKLVQFWRMHRKQGSISKQEYATIAALILYAFERQTGINLEVDTTLSCTLRASHP